MPTPTLEGPTLVLRKVRPWDFWSLYKNLHDPVVRQFEAAEFPGASNVAANRKCGRFAHLAYLFRRGLRALGLDVFADRNRVEYRLAVVPKQIGKAIGVVNLTEVDLKARHSDIGILLGKDYWGHGYMLEAEALLVRWAFDTLKFERLFANVNSENVASYITMKKLGFQKHGVLQQFTDARGRQVEMLRVVITPDTFRGL